METASLFNSISKKSKSLNNLHPERKGSWLQVKIDGHAQRHGSLPGSLLSVAAKNSHSVLLVVFELSPGHSWWLFQMLEVPPASLGSSGSGLSALGLGRRGLVGLTSAPVASSLVALPRSWILEGPRTHTLGAGPTSSVWGPGPSPSLAPSSPHPRLPLWGQEARPPPALPEVHP